MPRSSSTHSPLSCKRHCLATTTYQTTFSVSTLSGNIGTILSVGEPRHNWKLHADDFVPHCIDNQLRGRTNIKLGHKIFSMCFSRFHCDVQKYGDCLTPLSLSQKLQHLALPRRQLRCLGCGRTRISLAAGAYEHRGRSHAQDPVVRSQGFHRCR